MSNTWTNSGSRRASRSAPSRTAAAWAARGNPALMLAVATDPGSDREALAMITPTGSEIATMPVDVALAVVVHPCCPGGLADRLARHPDPRVRLAVVGHPGVGAVSEACLTTDRDPDVREAAVARWG